MDDVTLIGLRVLRQVAATGSFSGAALELDYTQSAVSRQMRVLEAAVGEPLFDRGRRGVTPTPAGRIVLATAGRVVAELEAADNQLAGRRDRLAGRVAIGAFPTACAVLIPRSVVALTRAHPGVEVVVDEASTPVLLRRLRAKRLDVAVVGAGTDETDIGDLVSLALPIVGLCVAIPVGHRLAQRAEITVDDLADESWIVGAGSPGEPQFGPWPGARDPRIVQSARNWSTRLGMVAAGLGLSVLPGTLAAALPPGVTAARVADQPDTGRGSLILTRPGGDPRTVSAVRAIREEASLLRDQLT
ncbi:LysR family transcriptional regulator [Williamsia sp. M5A3_1d]